MHVVFVLFVDQRRWTFRLCELTRHFLPIVIAAELPRSIWLCPWLHGLTTQGMYAPLLGAQHGLP